MTNHPTHAAAGNDLAELLHEVMTQDNDRLSDLTLGDALRIPAVENLLLALVSPDRPLSADPDELHVATDNAADRALAIAARLAQEVPMSRAANIVRLGDIQALDTNVAQLLVDFMSIGAIVATEYFIERRQR